MGRRRRAGAFFLARARYDELKQAIEKIASKGTVIQKGNGLTWFAPTIFAAQTYLEALDAAVTFSDLLKLKLANNAHDMGVVTRQAAERGAAA